MIEEEKKNERQEERAKEIDRKVDEEEERGEGEGREGEGLREKQEMKSGNFEEEFLTNRKQRSDTKKDSCTERTWCASAGP